MRCIDVHDASAAHVPDHLVCQLGRDDAVEQTTDVGPRNLARHPVPGERLVERSRRFESHAALVLDDLELGVDRRFPGPQTAKGLAACHLPHGVL